MSVIGTDVKIGGMRYRVRMIDDLHTVNSDGRKASLIGHILYSIGEIRVASGLSEDVQRATVWHELLHGILEQAGIDDESEQIIRVLGYGLVDVIRANPHLVEWTQQTK